jgi:hypothetical protein
MIGHGHTLMFGALATCGMIVGLFFIRYWHLTKDRFFGFFALAFVALSANWITLGAFSPEAEHRDYAYVIRLVAFLAIIVGIIDKNRRAPR